MNLSQRIRPMAEAAPWVIDEVKKLEDRIQQLETALDLVVPACSHLHHPKRHQHAIGEPCPVERIIEEAKEAKP